MASVKDASSGFTLAEMLVVLVVLAIVATFSIPKVLNTQQEQQKKAIFRETLAALQNALYHGTSTGQVRVTNIITYFSDRLNAVITCDTDSSVQGCWNVAVQGFNAEVDEPGLILANGASIVGFNNNPPLVPVTGLMVDYNGVAPPNVLNDDQLLIILCVQNNRDCSPWMLGDGSKVMGSIGPYITGGAGGVTLYEWIFTD